MSSKSAPYLIFADSYNPNIGGTICLHRLCHELNAMGLKAYLVQAFDTYSPRLTQKERGVIGAIRRLNRERKIRRAFKTKPGWNTPVISADKGTQLAREGIAVYPEIVAGNPLAAALVVRWFLHRPGFHTGKVDYGRHEYHIRYNDALEEIRFPDCELSASFLKVFYLPIDVYRCNDGTAPRDGYAYLIRKGKHKPAIHGEDWIQVDGLEHEEVARIMKSVKYFVSYDPYTAYSQFAVLAGCISIVVPEAGISKEQWYPNPNDRIGIAYGMDDIPHALATQDQLHASIQKGEDNIRRDVENFVRETQAKWQRQR